MGQSTEDTKLNDEGRKGAKRSQTWEEIPLQPVEIQLNDGLTAKIKFIRSVPEKQ